MIDPFALLDIDIRSRFLGGQGPRSLTITGFPIHEGLDCVSEGLARLYASQKWDTLLIEVIPHPVNHDLGLWDALCELPLHNGCVADYGATDLILLCQLQAKTGVLRFKSNNIEVYSLHFDAGVLRQITTPLSNSVSTHQTLTRLKQLVNAAPVSFTFEPAKGRSFRHTATNRLEPSVSLPTTLCENHVICQKIKRSVQPLYAGYHQLVLSETCFKKHAKSNSSPVQQLMPLLYNLYDRVLIKHKSAKILKQTKRYTLASDSTLLVIKRGQSPFYKLKTILTQWMDNEVKVVGIYLYPHNGS